MEQVTSMNPNHPAKESRPTLAASKRTAHSSTPEAPLDDPDLVFESHPSPHSGPNPTTHNSRDSTTTTTTTTTTSNHIYLPLGMQHFLAGTFGGILGVIGGHPLDTIKVRLQSQPSTPLLKYTGPYQCLLRIVREEKAIGLFKGMSSPLVGVALVNAFLFGVYGSVLSFLERRRGGSPSTSQSQSLHYSDIFIAGSASGLVNSLMSCPLELAKIQIQNQGPSQTQLKGPLDALGAAYRLQGLRGTYLGLGATVLRETPSYGAYFVAYELLCRHLSPSASASDVSDLGLMLAGGLAGSLAWMTTYPIDVLKTRIQSQSLTYSTSTPHPHPSLLQHFRSMLATEGWRVFFRGLDATLLRAFPTNALIFLGYTYTMRLVGGDQESAPQPP